MGGSRVRRHVLVALATVVAAVAVVEGSVMMLTHVVAPLVFTHYEHNPALASVPKCTRTRRGREADPVNVALVGTADEVAAAFAKAGWSRAASLSRASASLEATLETMERSAAMAPSS